MCVLWSQGLYLIYLCISNVQQTVCNTLAEIIIGWINKEAEVYGRYVAFQKLELEVGPRLPHRQLGRWLALALTWPACEVAGLGSEGVSHFITWKTGLRRPRENATLGRGKWMNISECLPQGGLHVTCFQDFISLNPHSNSADLFYRWGYSGTKHLARRLWLVQIIIGNTHCGLYVSLSILHVLFHFIFMTAHLLLLPDEETEAQRGSVSCPRLEESWD